MINDFEVPISSNGQRMWVCEFYRKFYLFLCILLLFHRVSDVSCASLELQRFSQKYVNLRFLPNYTRPANLSELIEYSPMKFPLELENVSITSHEESAENDPKIITLKLKTHLTVENSGNHHYHPEEKKGEIKGNPNLKKDSLSEIEYVANTQDRNAWKNPEKLNPLWLGYGKVEKLYTSKEEGIPYVEYNKESKRSIEEEIPKGVELALVEDRIESDNMDNAKWIGYGRVEKIKSLKENIAEDELSGKSNSSNSEEIPKNVELRLMEDRIESDNMDNTKWIGYGRVEKIKSLRENIAEDELTGKSNSSDSEEIPKNVELRLVEDRIESDNVDNTKWFGYGRVEKLKTSEKNIAEDKFAGESTGSDSEGIPENVELTLVADRIESDNMDNAKWLGYGRVEKIYTFEENIAKDKFAEELNTSDSEEIPKYVELALTEDGIKLSNPDDSKWRGYGKVEKVEFLEKNKTSDKLDKESDISDSEEISKNAELVLDSDYSEDNKVLPKVIKRSKSAKGRQFVFHPYIPYGKDISPDEKISIGAILPVKMVKFVKSMVEEAPWEQMFIKMVRMVVDQFVDKIIEKMFADKGGDHSKKRSIDVFLSPSWVLPTFKTPVVRLKRSTDSKIHSEEDEDISTMLISKRVSQDTSVTEKKTPEERMTWLDHFLDFVFPNSKSNASDENTPDRLEKRDTHNAQLFKMLVTLFINAFEKTSGIITDAKDTLRYKMLKEILPYLYQKRHTKPNSGITSNSVGAMKMSHRKLTEFMKRNDVSENNHGGSVRRKRSTRNHKEEENRLWQSTSRRHKPQHHRSREDCSLRKACNAGRLLSRLPSVQDITLQLRSHGNEPHWDALIWGMKKKRCSKIFCKRQRSPKGSRHPWNSEMGRPSRRIEIVTEPPDELDGMDNSTT